MSRGLVVDLAECSTFRQTLAARPPAIVHGTALLLMVLLAAALLWAALVKANLVVRAAGRVRSDEIPTRVFTSTSADLEGRVVHAPFAEGDTVREGDVLVRLDTAHLDNRIAKVQRTLESAAEEISKLTGLETLINQQLQAAKDKAQAELLQAQAALARAADRRASEIRLAQAGVKAAEDHWQRMHKLTGSRAVTAEDLMKAETEVRQAREKLVQAELPVEDSQVAVARRAVELVDREFAVRRAEVQARLVVKQGEADAAHKELANLNLQRIESELRSPIDGVVVAGRVQAGDVLERGKAVLEISPQGGYRFEAVVPGDGVGQLRVGMPVRIKFDAYDYQKYGTLDGTVTYLSPDSKLPGADKSAGEASDATAARKSPAAFIVRVELLAEEVGRGALRGRVKLGLGGTAEIVTGRESVLAILVKRIRQAISLG
jgi:multidrug efflux pump subunit AcrA (membrane-fusion protein)